jgi:ribosomal protein S18 acetylase RimI-like enzyme
MTIIRRMLPHDTAGVQRVARETWAATYREIIPDEVQARFLERAYSDESLRRRREQGLMLVAEEHGAIVGFANAVQTGDHEADLAAIYVLPEAQGGGIGSRLLDAALQALPDVSTLFVRVERDNLIGRRFYEAKGFVVVEEIVEQIAGQALHLILMRLDR